MKEQADVSRDAAPIEALALVVHDLIHQENATPGGDLVTLMSAAATANQFDSLPAVRGDLPSAVDGQDQQVRHDRR